MRYGPFGRLFTMKTLIRASFIALSLSSIGVAHPEPSSYRAPAQNYWQNNWMSGGGH